MSRQSHVSTASQMPSPSVSMGVHDAVQQRP
jgi:hypothetical protein